MTNTIGPSHAGATFFTPPVATATPSTASTQPLDAVTGESLGVTTVKKGVAIGDVSAAVSATIQSSFPLDDLSKIATEGRWAQGFRLDSGTLRLLWLRVRRTK